MSPRLATKVQPREAGGGTPPAPPRISIERLLTVLGFKPVWGKPFGDYTGNHFPDRIRNRAQEQFEQGICTPRTQVVYHCYMDREEEGWELTIHSKAMSAPAVIKGLDRDTALGIFSELDPNGAEVTAEAIRGGLGWRY